MAKEGNLAQKTYQQVSQQNGSTFAQMLKKYDKSILDLPNIGEILAYAGKDVVGTLFFLDTLKENPNVFEEYAFDSKAEPYFDDELIELFIQRAKEIRQMEGNYPKSSKVAQEILSIYKENRRQKLAKAKGVRLEEIKNAELFVPLKEEQDQFPLNTFIKQGDPSYVIFYLLNTMGSSEIEFLKKKGDGISARSLNTKSIKEELSGSLKRFMGKYHYEQGRIFRFNVEKNGVYFMDDAVLKEGKVIHFDPKKYFMADGLIIDLEKNEILNLAGVEAEKVKPLNEKIKGKKLSLKEEKGLRILLADDKEVIVAKEGRKLSPFELIARKKGKRYAEDIRREDSCIFDIPNLLDIVEYAAKDVTPYLIEYLQSLKPRVEDKFESDMDTLVHLFMAGYVPCYSPKLTEKYIQKVNALAPIQVDENGVKQVSVPKEIAISLAESYRQDKRELLAKSRGCNLEDISDLDVLTVTSLAEKNMITPYYRSDEAICTLKDDNRHLSQYMINAVKRNVDEIKRENFLNPRRDDEYGTSVISIQVPKGGGNISIKNRYNHTLDRVSGENPDNTFNSNPDNISEGMLSAMERELPVVLYTSRAWPPHSHVTFGEDSRLFYYDYEVYGVYFSQNHYLKNGQVGNLKDCYELNCGYLTKEGDLLCTDLYDGSREIVDVLKNETKGEKLRWETKEGLTHIYAGDRLVAKLKGTEFVGLYLNKTMHLPRNFMEDAPLLEEVIAPSVVHMDGSVFKNAPNLKKVELPNCLYAGANSLSMAKEADVNAPFVFDAEANNQLKARQVPSMTLYSLLVNYPKEFENKKLKMQYHHGQYDIYADGKIVAEIGHADGLMGLYLNHTDTLGYGQLSQLQTLVAPLVEKIPYSTFGGDCSVLKRLELPNCCYMLSTPEDAYISKFSREKCQIIAPYVYNEKDGFLKRCILRKLDPDIEMNEKTEMFFNKYFKDKKVTIEEDENQKYLCANGERLITYDKTRNKISGVLLPEIEEINLEVLNEECFSLRSLSLPDVKRIASTGNELSKIVNYCLDHLSIPKVEDLGNKGIFLLKGYKKLKIDFNKEAVEKAGVFFFNDVIFDSKQGIFVETTFERETFAGLLNQNIKNSADFNFEPPKITVVQKGEKTSIMINGEEMVAFEKGDVAKLNLSYVKDMPMWTIQHFDKLQEITMENLETMGNGSVISCEKLKKINFPKLKDVSRYCFDNLGGGRNFFTQC